MLGTIRSMQSASLSRVLGAVGVVLMSACGHTTEAQQAECRGPWTVNYSVSGGIAGISQHLTLDHTGTVVVTNRGQKASFTVAADRFARICHIVQQQNFDSLPTTIHQPSNIPDMINSSVTITYSGRVYELGPVSKALLAEIGPLMTEGIARAEDEKWIRAGAFRLGRTWQVEEEVRDSEGMWHGELWKGVWTRIGDSNTFDAVWRNNQSNQELRDTVILDSVGRGKIAMHRASSKIRYDGYYSAEDQSSITGLIQSHLYCTWRVSIKPE